jgi:hypothetical protein
MKKPTLKKKQAKPENLRKIEGSPFASNVGVILLELHHALRTAERCRITLRQLGYSQKRWQEIVKDVNPELRFMLRPQIVDDIITHLQSTGKPIDRNALAERLNLQGSGHLMRIKQAITTNLRSGVLKRFGENKIGLPAWTTKDKRG